MTTLMAPPRACPRCGTHLRRGNDGPLCSPCSESLSAEPPMRCAEDVDLVKLVAGLMLTHDALHPGEKLYVREALAEHGVDADHCTIWQAAGKLRRRHGLILSGDSREPGYRVSAWLRHAWRVAAFVAAPSGNRWHRATNRLPRTQPESPPQAQLRLPGTH